MANYRRDTKAVPTRTALLPGEGKLIRAAINGGCIYWGDALLEGEGNNAEIVYGWGVANRGIGNHKGKRGDMACCIVGICRRLANVWFRWCTGTTKVTCFINQNICRFSKLQFIL